MNYVIKNQNKITSLSIIAMSQYGDATKATDIANANNLFTGQLAAGQVLVIPPIINSRYQATSALPYAQFMNTVLMSMYPQFKFNPPKQHDGFLSEVVHVLVDTAAMILGYMVYGPIGAAIATALADAAYQDLAIHEGWQPHFDLEDSVVEGIEAGVATYIMPPAIGQPSNAIAAPGALGTSNAVSSFSNVVYNAGLNATNSVTAARIIQAVMDAGGIAVLDQLTEMALGERNKFDFNAVITSMTSAAAMYYVDSAEQELPVGQFPDDVIQSFTGNIIQSASYDTITGQTLYVDQIAASSLGATLGQYIGNEIIYISKANESSTNPANINNQNGNNAQNNSTTGNNGLNNSSSSASGNNSGNNSSSSNGNNSASSGNNSANNYMNYQSSQNPGNNQSGFFNSGNTNANLSSNNASQNYSANNASGSSYGSGNSGSTSKVNQDLLTFVMGDVVTAELLGNSQAGQIIFNSAGNSINQNNFNQQTYVSNKWQNLLNDFSNITNAAQQGFNSGMLLSPISTSNMTNAHAAAYYTSIPIGEAFGLINGSFEAEILSRGSFELANYSNALINYGIDQYNNVATYLLNKLGIFSDDTITSSFYNTRSVYINNYIQNANTNATSNFMVLVAKEDQILSGYNPDAWSMVQLNSGDIVYGGIPGQSSYYTSQNTLLVSGNNQISLFESLQVAPNPLLGYRPAMGEYEVTQDVRVPYGTVSANPLLGIGGADQYFITNFSTNLRLVNTIQLGVDDEYNMSPLRANP